MENNKSPTENETDTEIEKVKPIIPQHYIKVPKEIVLEATLPEHRISILTYFNYNQTWDKTVNYSPIHMIQWSGYRPNWRKGKNDNIYDKFRNCMNWYFANGYIFNFDKEKYIQNTFQSSLLNKEKVLPLSNFGIIYDFEVEAIMKYQSQYKPLNKSTILLLLAYIRAFTWLRKTEISGHSEKSKKEKPEIFHGQYKYIGKSLGIKENMISKATKVLEELEIVKTYRMPSYQDQDGAWHTDDIIYVCPYKLVMNKKGIHLCIKEEYDWYKELEYGITYLRECKYFSKKFYQE